MTWNIMFFGIIFFISNFNFLKKTLVLKDTLVFKKYMHMQVYTNYTSSFAENNGIKYCSFT